VQKVAFTFLHPSLFPYASFTMQGVENIPHTGPVILVGNHRSYFDPVAVALVVARSGRTVRFLGKKEVFDAPVVGQVASLMGGIRVDRGTGSDAPLEAAAAALAGGDMVALMPQGTIPRGRAFYEPTLKGRWGAARLAALTKAPVIPIGLWGTEKVWPRSAKVPNVLNLTDPPKVSITVGEPVALNYRSADVDTRRIMKAIMDLLPAESREKREPTADEIRLATPSHMKAHMKANATDEAARRPGTD
jgi:putative phosphoserine phosphatase/1-acylglycerol-3-phosphate O-acyltransferase